MLEISIKKETSGYYISDGEGMVEGPFNSEKEAKKEVLLHKVMYQIQSDIVTGDLTAVFELLSKIPVTKLEGFLSEEK